ncbi:GAF and ANTAR domain-containing protein [Gordonia sinesedis]
MTEVAIGFASRMPEIVRELQAEREDTNAVLLAISQAAVDTIPGAEYASVTMVTKGEIATPVAVGAPALKCDELQQELGEGPCVRAAVSDETIWVDDMRTETRWPRFADGAAGIGINSMVCFCLYIDGNDFGALNLHSALVDGFDAEARSMGELFAAHAAIAFAAVREREQLRMALSSRDLIGQAKGMIMERYRIDADAAFRLLARLSQDSNTKLVEVARQVIAAGPDSN